MEINLEIGFQNENIFAKLSLNYSKGKNNLQLVTAFLNPSEVLKQVIRSDGLKRFKMR